MKRCNSSTLAAVCLLLTSAVQARGSAMETLLPPSAHDAGTPLALLQGAAHNASRQLDDGTSLVAGQQVDRAAACGPAARAFVSRRDAAGLELWRLENDGIFGQTLYFEPDHVLSSSVRDLTVDPASGRSYAVIETLLGWRDGLCTSGVDTALGTYVVSFTRSGEVESDAYLGTLPAGPPPGKLLCSELCAPSRFPRYSGQSIELTAQGEIVVSGDRLGTRPEDQGQPAALFTEALTTTLERVVPAPEPFRPLATKAGCAMVGKVRNIKPLVETEVDNGDTPFGAQVRDDCSVKFRPLPQGNPFGVGPGHGFQLELDPPSGPIPYPPKLVLDTRILFPSLAVVDIQLQDQGTFQWVTVGSRVQSQYDPTMDKHVLEIQIRADDAPRWIGATVKVRVKIVLWTETAQRPCQDGDIDYMDDDYGI